MGDTQSFKEMLRMSYKDFKKLLNSIEQHIMPHQVNGGNKVKTAPERLALTSELAVYVSSLSDIMSYCLCLKDIGSCFDCFI